ncbi:hypothetical protein NA57DRAFT_80472 [Rhizodiscina lignyota]|uniref:Uncharacterized protein n=1 Tax=Rhizodiscina lignyota TaxID=1504668 RepID=A0A9P4I957_9PEZI|nr:hypothetical protein NA57DRAFT_80472 [Rhizodiscina lignyota]
MTPKGPGNNHFRPRHISTFWKSRIPDIETLKKLVPNSVLVGFDIKSSLQQDVVKEIGLAFLRVDGQAPHFWPGSLQSFHDQNKFQVSSVQVCNRVSLPREKFDYGTEFVVQAEEVAPLVERLVSLLKGKGNLVLVGFDLFHVMRWISREAPALSSLFMAWAIGVDSNHSGCRRGSNDAVRCLAILSGLVSSAPFTAPSPEVTLYNRPRKSSGGDHLTVRIATADGSTLPSELKSPKAVAEHFAEYELETVAVNRRDQYTRENEASYWWLSFQTAESLESFTTKTNGSMLNGKRLVVDSLACMDKGQI